MAVIVINGTPGTGKTTIARMLATALGIEDVLHTDTMKAFFQILKCDETSYCATHEAYRYLGEKSKENVIRGFDRHCSHFRGWFLKIIEISNEKGKHIIIDGVQATPEFFESIPTEDKIGFLLTLDDTEEHKKRFNFKNSARMKENKKWIENYASIRLIDSYLRSQANATSNFYIIENVNLKNSLNFIIEKSLCLLKGKRGEVYAKVH